MEWERELREDFGAFYRAHLDVVLAFCFARTHDAEMSADLAAEVFAAALTARERYAPGRGSVRQWLLGIAAHKTTDALRRGRVERRARRRLGLAEIAWTEEDLDHVARVETLRLAELLGDLPEDQRRAIQARVVDEHGYAEIAHASGVSAQVVRQRVSRGLAAMRRHLTKEPR